MAVAVEQFSSQNIEGEIGIRDHCGIVGVWDPAGEAPSLIRTGLTALYNRGPQGSGYSLYDATNGHIASERSAGPISTILTEDEEESDGTITQLGSQSVGIGHDRYKTKGKIVPENQQPITLTSTVSVTQESPYSISEAHNGNFLPETYNFLRQQVPDAFEDASDTYLHTAYLLQQRPLYNSWMETFQNELPKTEGAFSTVALTGAGSLFAFADPRKIRPLKIGMLESGGVIFASEQGALDKMGASFMRNVQPGEIIEITQDGKITIEYFGDPKHKQGCVLEAIYIAETDQILETDVRVQEGRENSGRLLAENMTAKKIVVDAVVPVHRSGDDSALGVSKGLDKPIVHAITTRPQTGRSFLKKDQTARKNAVAEKHNIIPDGVRGKNVVKVDDSEIRANTTRVLVAELIESGVTSIHEANASAPFVDNCDLGVDLPNQNELVAFPVRNKPLSEIEIYVAGEVNADSTTYLTIEQTAEAFGGTPEDFCFHCMGGDHPIRGRQKQYDQRETELVGEPKMAVFISGEGTTLQTLIDATEQGVLRSTIVDVVSNKSEAHGLQRATEHNIPTTFLPSAGLLKDKTKRNAYGEQMRKHVEESRPDMIVLAGFDVIIPDNFLTAMQEMQIPVINLHPALLPKDGKNTVMTSKGHVPVLRGLHAIERAYEMDRRKEMPVSGATLHQVFPSEGVDTGRIIVREEVGRRADESFEEFRQRMKRAEDDVLLTGLKRVIHTMHKNIDISKGQFAW